LLILGSAFAGLSFTSRPRGTSDCSSKIVIVKGPDGEPRECVCINGALATCFKPGP